MNRSQIILLLSIMLFSIPKINFAQDSKNIETEFLVRGVCKMCKARIENAGYIKGVKTCDWNKETQTMKVVFNGEKTDLETIHKSIASAGHSTDKFEADSIAYQKLPACCAYDDGVSVH